MKNLNWKYLFFIPAIALLAACGGNKEHDHDHGDAAEGEWKEMDDFHLLMAETFHPYKDSADLAPIKNHAEHLAMEADKWSTATLPEKVDNDEVKASLQQLKTDTRALADKVKNGASDEEVAAGLTGVHDLFHKIQEAWYAKGEHDHH